MEKPKYVTTDCDLWNSADGSGFFVGKGDVKLLPEDPSSITLNALNQKLLREPTLEEVSKYEFIIKLEDALKRKLFKAGDTYDLTLKNYQTYLESLELEKTSNNNLDTKKKFLCSIQDLKEAKMEAEKLEEEKKLEEVKAPEEEEKKAPEESKGNKDTEKGEKKAEE